MHKVINAFTAHMCVCVDREREALPNIWEMNLKLL